MEHFLEQQLHFFDVFSFVGVHDVQAKQTVDFLEKRQVLTLTLGLKQVLESLHSSLPDVLREMGYVCLEYRQHGGNVRHESRAHSFGKLENVLKRLSLVA